MNAIKRNRMRDDDDDDRPLRRGRRRDFDDRDDDENDDELDDALEPQSDGQGMAITALVLGIVAILMVIGLGGGAVCLGGLLFCCCPIGPTATGIRRQWSR